MYTYFQKQVLWNYTYLYTIYIFWGILFFKNKQSAVLSHKIDFMIHYFAVIHCWKNMALDS